MEMGAQVKCNNYLAFFNSDKDVWTDIKTTLKVGDAWSTCCTEMMLKKSQACSIFKQDEIECGPEFVKETLKQKMLEHEQIFREQVHELHRLYKVQKLLMDDLKKQNFCPPTFSSTTKQGEFLFHFCPEQQTSKAKRNMLDFFSGSVKEKDCRGHQHPTLGTNYMQSPGSTLMEQNTLIVLNPKEINYGSNKNPEPISTACRTFDLELPADEYVDDEAMDQIREDTITRRTVNDIREDLEFESEVELTLGTGCERSKKKYARQIGSLLDMGFHKQEREEMEKVKQSRSNEEKEVFSAASTRTEVHTEGALRKERCILPNQSFLGDLWGSGNEDSKHEYHGPEWQKFVTEPEKSIKERHSLDVEAGERSTQENPKQPHWIFQVKGLPTAILRHKC